MCAGVWWKTFSFYLLLFNLNHYEMCKIGSLDIAPTQDRTHVLRIGFVFVGVGFIIYTKGKKQIKKGKL